MSSDTKSSKSKAEPKIKLYNGGWWKSRPKAPDDDVEMVSAKFKVEYI